MYRIDADKDKRLIRIEASGHLQLEELKNICKDMKEAAEQFGSDKIAILALLERLDPISQENVAICIENFIALSARINKIASVHKRVVTRMQNERLIKEVNIKNGWELNAKCFNTVSEALGFLYE